MSEVAFALAEVMKLYSHPCHFIGQVIFDVIVLGKTVGRWFQDTTINSQALTSSPTRFVGQRTMACVVSILWQV